MGGSLGGGSVDYSGAEKQYSQSQKEIQEMLKQAQAQGRTDIVDYLQKAYNINQPYMQAGTTSLDAWMNSLGIGSEGAQGQQNLKNKFQQSPGYQYAIKQAQNASQRQAAASGMGMSGAEQKQLSAQAQGLADQDWSQWLNNYQSNLANITGIGRQAAGQQAGFTNEAGGTLANLGLQYAGMDAQSREAAANAIMQAQMAEQSQNAQSKGSFLGGLGQLVGGVGGFMLGGPAGAAIGSSLGGSLGGGASGGLAGMFGSGGSSGGGSNWLSRLFSGNDANTRYANTIYPYNPNDNTQYNYAFR